MHTHADLHARTHAHKTHTHRCCAALVCERMLIALDTDQIIKKTNVWSVFITVVFLSGNHPTPPLVLLYYVPLRLKKTVRFLKFWSVKTNVCMVFFPPSCNCQCTLMVHTSIDSSLLISDIWCIALIGPDTFQITLCYNNTEYWILTDTFYKHRT